MNEYRMIDGNDIEKFILSFIQLVKRSFNYCLEAYKKYFIIATVVFFGVLAMGLYNIYKIPKYYQATTAYTFHYFNYKVYGQMVEELNTLATTGSYNNLASALHLSVQQATTILGIDGRDAYGKLLSTNTSDEHGPLYFKVKVTDNATYIPLQRGLTNYLNNSSAIQNELKSADIQASQNKVLYLERNIAIIDSIIQLYLNKNVDLIKQNDSNANLGYVLSLLKYKDQLEENKIDKVKLINKLQHPVQILYEFTVPQKYANADYTISILWLLLKTIIVTTTVLILVRAFRDTK